MISPKYSLHHYSTFFPSKRKNIYFFSIQFYFSIFSIKTLTPPVYNTKSQFIDYPQKNFFLLFLVARALNYVFLEDVEWSGRENRGRRGNKFYFSFVQVVVYKTNIVILLLLHLSFQMQLNLDCTHTLRVYMGKTEAITIRRRKFESCPLNIC